MNKKGAEMSLNVIIVAAIALLVLVILSVIFMGRIGIFSKESAGTRYCLTTLNGNCNAGLGFDNNPNNCLEGETKIGLCDDGSYCCKKI